MTPRAPRSLTRWSPAPLPPGGRERAERAARHGCAPRVCRNTTSPARLPPLPEGHRILVPGQVEDDASILKGAGDGADEPCSAAGGAGRQSRGGGDLQAASGRAGRPARRGDSRPPAARPCRCGADRSRPGGPAGQGAGGLDHDLASGVRGADPGHARHLPWRALLRRLRPDARPWPGAGLAQADRPYHPRPCRADRLSALLGPGQPPPLPARGGAGPAGHRRRAASGAA